MSAAENKALVAAFYQQAFNDSQPERTTEVPLKSWRLPHSGFAARDLNPEPAD